ncbi:pilus assembly protein [Bradyrhizobium arachidis]|uniref:TadE/TadG family type IV pilus assembly protein n=1 Tax=Bradyrhizobium TaxID=374 RepID=UPI00188C022F|nr:MULTISPECIES: TadE/TadG family type IV pilus assembly protein [Bradyrhizobium]MDN4987344.1 pilus assembly protein [Bradyrhizobium sp. WYCCWR 13022]QOZ50456.1 pilus assembly protein [Bradyrhizobium sp. CCBAU 53338]UVO37396.1 pilus assembly protein [Bradyrhizobium arachidis]
MRFARDEGGATAVEFAMMLPIFLTLIFGIVVFGSYFAMIHGVQQLAAEAARTSVAGLSDTERNSLAQSYVTSSVTDYPLLDATKVNVVAAPSISDPNVYVVTVSYDASSSFIFTLPFVPVLSPSISRSAVIPYGGF